MQIFISKVPPCQEKVKGHLNSSPVSVEHGVTDSWGITSDGQKYSTNERNSLSLADMSTVPSICLFRELAALKAYMIHHNQWCPARRLRLSLLFCWLGSFKVHADMIMLGHVWAHQDEIVIVWKHPPPPSEWYGCIKRRAGVTECESPIPVTHISPWNHSTGM